MRAAARLTYVGRLLRNHELAVVHPAEGDVGVVPHGHLTPLVPSKPVQPCRPGMIFPLVGCRCCCLHGVVGGAGGRSQWCFEECKLQAVVYLKKKKTNLVR